MSSTEPLLLLNRARADRVMRSHGLDGLVAAAPLDVYYLSSHWSPALDTGGDPACFAVLPLDESRPATLVAPSSEARRLVADGATWMPNLVGYHGPGSDASDAAGPADADELAVRDRLRASGCAAAIPALVRALRDAGLEHATLGIDDLRLERWLRAAGLDRATFVHAEHAFREIRRVKSPAEIALLRTAARVNEIACLEAAAQVHEGAEWHEVENHYMAELANRGGRGRWLSCGGPSSLRVPRGETLALDAVGRYRGYHGAFGRTAVVGAPPADALRRNAAMQRGCFDACATLRPGMRYSEVAALYVRAVRDHGFTEFVRAIPHSIGLHHDDDPAPMTLAGPDRGDPLLEPGLVLHVELPHAGPGRARLLLGDTLLVTENGVEPLTSLQTDLLVSP
jgi:Xaa-Pro dipeptidase